MDSDRTPADVIYDQLAEWELPALQVRDDIIDALATAGFRVTPIPDDNTRALAARLRNAAAVACEAWGESDDADVPVVEVGGYPETHTLGTHDLLSAAALLDGQPQDRPDRCPTCGSDDPVVFAPEIQHGQPVAHRCPDSWHVGGSGDTR